MPLEVERDANVQDVHAMSCGAAQPDVMWAQHRAGTYRSVDGNARSSRTASPKPTDFGFTIVADPVNSLRAWTVPARADTHRYAIAGALRVCRTDDGGRRWPSMAAPWRWRGSRAVLVSARTQASRGTRWKRSCRRWLRCLGCGGHLGALRALRFLRLFLQISHQLFMLNAFWYGLGPAFGYKSIID